MSHRPKIGGQPVLEESSEESSSSDDDKSGILSPQKAATRDNLAQAEVRRFRNGHPEVFLRKGVPKICGKFTGEHPCRSVISVKLLCNFIEIALRHGCSPVNLLHISRTPFPRNTSGWLLLEIGFFKIRKFDRLLFRFKFISSLPLEIRRKFLANHFEFRVLHSTSVFLQCSIFFVWLL